MQDWDEIRKRFSHWPHRMWQWATTDGKCVVCDIHGYETAQELLVYVEGEGKKQYCKMCYFSKFVHDDDDIMDAEIEAMVGDDNDVFHVDDLPPEVMTDGRGNTTLDNW